MSADVIRSPRRVAPTLAAAVLAVAYLSIGPKGADLPAQLFRARLFGVEGFGIWDNWWYAGHNLPGYSVLFPPLAWLTTPQVVAAAASVVTAAAFEALAHDAYGDDAWVGATWLGAATVVELLSGRLTFAFGLCGVALTALALQRARGGLAVAAAFLTALASPVAALFVALAGVTVFVTGRSRRAGAGVIAAALLPVVALAVVFPEGGSQPFAWGTFWPLLLTGSVLLVVLPRDARTLRTATALYLSGCLLAYVIATPVGANAARLGELVAGPLAALILVPRRRFLMLAILALPLTYIQVHDAIGDIEHGNRSPSDTPAYYQPLVGFLERQPGAAGHTFRVEVPFTQGHWESDYLAPLFPLARGWERQLDIRDNRLFYGGRLDATTYETWLHQLAVRYVAVADAPLDYSAKAEAKLIESGLPDLRLVARLRHWRVYAVRNPTPIATGAGSLTEMGADSLTLKVTRPGRTYVRVRWSPYWQLSGIDGCVEPMGGFTEISARSSGTARLTISFALGRIGADSPRCDWERRPGGHA